MGIYIYVYEAVDPSEELAEEIDLVDNRALKRRFKDFVFYGKMFRSTHLDYTNVFRSRGLKWKEWDYKHSDIENNIDYYQKGEEIIEIPDREFNFKEHKTAFIKVKELLWFSGRGKISSLWHSLDNMADYSSIMSNKLRYILTIRDLEVFIEWFVRRQHRDEFKEKVLELMTNNDNIFMYIDW